MLISGIIIVVFIGFLVINIISIRYSLIEKIGLSFPIGIGIQTITMLVMNMVGLKLTAIGMLLSGILLISILSIILYQRREKIKAYYKDNPLYLNTSGYNLVWLFLIIVIAYLEYMNFSKCMYFPTFDRDSLAGFDTIGYVIAEEHTFRNLSIFQQNYISTINNAGSYITYAPMVQLSYGFVYLLGAETSKIIPALMYLSLLIVFYGSVKRVSGRTGAAIATFFMMITPEMIGFSSLSATNLIHAVYASMGIIYIALWFKFRERRDLYLGSVLLGLNIWTRTEGVVFICTALFVVFVDTVINKKGWINMLPVILAFSPALLWIIFTRIYNFHAESIAILHPYWDAEKAEIIWKYMKLLYTSTLYYGWTFIFFAVSLILNGWYLFRKRDNLALLAMIVLSSLLYMIVLYQIDYKWDSIENVLAYSAKRFMFCFIPMFWFYIVSNRVVRIGLNHLKI